MSDEKSIRERAYALWEAQGRPEGRESDHWEQARREIEEAQGAGSQSPAPPPQPRAKPASKGETVAGAGKRTPRAKPADQAKAPAAKRPRKG